MTNVFNPKSKLILTAAINSDHGVSGHLFEIIEYFYYFKFWCDLDVCILISFTLSHQEYLKALENYDFTQSELKEYLSHTYFQRPKIIVGNVLFVDGIQSYREKVLIKGQKLGFRCSLDSGFKDGILLQDKRIYSDYPESIHYIKKILFDKYRLRPENTKNPDVGLVYATRNCRELSYNDIQELKKLNKKLLVISEKPYNVPEFTDLKPPVENVFNLFDTFYYTPVNTKYCKEFDCSPRFPAECRFYHKTVKYLIPYSYPGLNVRIYDIENNFESLFLRPSDLLMSLIKPLI